MASCVVGSDPLRGNRNVGVRLAVPLCIDRNQNTVGQKLYPCELRTKSETGEWGRARQETGARVGRRSSSPESYLRARQPGEGTRSSGQSPPLAGVPAIAPPFIIVRYGLGNA